MTTTAVIACGALVGHVQEIALRNDLDLYIQAIDPLLHNRPSEIAPAVEREIARLSVIYPNLAVAYADCGTYGALDELCVRYNLKRLVGQHCYDVFFGAKNLQNEFESEPGTYLLTDYLVRTFKQSVESELGLDKYPFLRDDYFHGYRRLLWIAQHPTAELNIAADQIAKKLNLNLEVIHVGDMLLEQQLLTLVAK